MTGVQTCALPILSVGIASLAGDRPVTAEQLVARADGALYRAKEGGRNRIILSGGTSTGAAPAAHA